MDSLFIAIVVCLAVIFLVMLCNSNKDRYNDVHEKIVNELDSLLNPDWFSLEGDCRESCKTSSNNCKVDPEHEICDLACHIYDDPIKTPTYGDINEVITRLAPREKKCLCRGACKAIRTKCDQSDSDGLCDKEWSRCIANC